LKKYVFKRVQQMGSDGADVTCSTMAKIGLSSQLESTDLASHWPCVMTVNSQCNVQCNKMVLPTSRMI